MAFSRYRDALRTPGVARVLATSLVARAPNGMAGLAIVLVVSPQQGYARAGMAVGMSVATTCISNPVMARFAVSLGPRAVLLAAAMAYAGCMSALGVVPSSSYGAQLACCAGAGLTVPPVVAVVRGLWPRLSPPDDVQALYGLEATAQELVFIVGPALVAVIAAVAGPRTAVIATGLLGLVGIAALTTSPALDAHGGAQKRVRHRLLRTSPLPLYVAVAFSLTVAFNMTDLAVVAFVSGRHASAGAGVLLAVWSAGSMLGGLLFAGRAGVVDDGALAAGCLAVAAAIATAAAAPGRVGLAVILFVGGMTIAPALGRLYTRVAGVVPEGATIEAFAWIGVGFLAGSSLGSALGGVTVAAWGARATFLLAGAVPVLLAGVLLAVTRRRANAAKVYPLAS
jgi:predicted MFS family arabinose efflux permease